MSADVAVAEIDRNGELGGTERNGERIELAMAPSFNVGELIGVDVVGHYVHRVLHRCPLSSSGDMMENGISLKPGRRNKRSGRHVKDFDAIT